MAIELTKSQKKIARELIDYSLQKDCAGFLGEVEAFMNNRDREGKSPHKLYLDLFRKVDSFDSFVARRYDNVRGSTYFSTLVGLLIDKVLVEEDLAPFDEEMRQKLLYCADMLTHEPKRS